MSLVEQAKSDDRGEQQQAKDVARGRVLVAALHCVADRYDEHIDESPDPTGEYHDDMLAEAVLEYAEVLKVLADS